MTDPQVATVTVGFFINKQQQQQQQLYWYKNLYIKFLWKLELININIDSGNLLMCRRHIA